MVPETNALWHQGKHAPTACYRESSSRLLYLGLLAAVVHEVLCLGCLAGNKLVCGLRRLGPCCRSLHDREKHECCTKQ
jgi:hypothetical protein